MVQITRTGIDECSNLLPHRCHMPASSHFWEFIAGSALKVIPLYPGTSGHIALVLSSEASLSTMMTSPLTQRGALSLLLLLMPAVTPTWYAGKFWELLSVPSREIKTSRKT
jgi:hypothetical protein